MTNKAIANVFNYLGKIMELHNENPFKIRSYQNAYITLRKLDRPLTELADEEISSIKGVGKAIGEKIRELINTGDLQTLEKYREKTPEGIQDMLNLKGFGPKKIKVVWKELGIEDVGSLQYACIENRLIELKGFGAKTQADLLKNIEFFFKSKDKQRYGDIVDEAFLLMKEVQEQFGDKKCHWVGEWRRCMPVIDTFEILVEGNKPASISPIEDFEMLEDSDHHFKGKYKGSLDTVIHFHQENGFEEFKMKLTGGNLPEMKQGLTEHEQYSQAGLPYIIPEMRDLSLEDQKKWSVGQDSIVALSDIKGVVHSHCTYSDGIHSLEEMAKASKEKGYQYLVISDHSKSAFYAGGLKEADLEKQWKEIDELNESIEDFTIFKGIESDILSSGALDYDDSVLANFDIVIASVHSNLNMDEEKATKRVVTAVENSYTHILGHPTGRLILSRRGYPLDHKKVIDACAANGVVIELNASPYRLDLDWTWIPYAMDKGVKISINPDAHSIAGIDNIQFGVLAARKGGLHKDFCVNTLNSEQFISSFHNI